MALVGCGGGAETEEPDDSVERDLTAVAALSGVYAGRPTEAQEGTVFELRLHGEDTTFSLAAIGRIQCGKPGYSCGKEERPRWGGLVDVTRISGSWSAAAQRVTLKPKNGSGQAGPPMSIDVRESGGSLSIVGGASELGGVLDTLVLTEAAHTTKLADLEGKWNVTLEVRRYDAEARKELVRAVAGYDAVVASAAHVVTFTSGKVRETIGGETRKGVVRAAGGPRSEVDVRGATPGVLYFKLDDGSWSVVRIQSTSGQKLKLLVVNPLDENDGTWWQLERAP